VLTDIAQSRRTEERIRQGMGDGVTVRMSLESGVLGNVDSSEDQQPPRLETV
jgi:hypothetical protein